jgi:2-oxoisovalerate dehydrogenase E2 component (dihydrolipoyl transacylase)
MALTVNMPQLGESVTEGTIAKWLKQPGEFVAKYESIAEVVTDKVNAEIPAPADGSMGEHLVSEGTTVAVGEPICTIETVEQAQQQSAWAQPTLEGNGEAAPTPPPTTPPAPAPAPAPAQPPPPVQVPAAAPEPAPVIASAEPATQSEVAAFLHVTPAVRMLSREHAVDLTQVPGSGIGGRVTKKDVLEFVQKRDAGRISAAAQAAPAAAAPQVAAPPVQPAPAPTAPAAPAPELVSPPAAPPLAPAATPQPPPAALAPPPPLAQPMSAQLEGRDTLVPLTPIRKAIAEHMSRSKHVSPHAWLVMEVDMTNIARLRALRKADFEKRNGAKLTFLPFVARAVCDALREYPSLNATWSDDGVVEKGELHLGIAVALDDNLIVPVVRNADRLTLAGLATTMADLAERGRQNRLKLDEITGGTFTLNNTGSLGTVLTQPIINQPQAAILAMDMVMKRPVVVNDAIAIRSMMNICLAFDHRINDGLQASRFLGAVKSKLEHIDESAML